MWRSLSNISCLSIHCVKYSTVNNKLRDKLIYSTVNGLIKEREIEKARSNWLQKERNNIPQSQVLQRIRKQYKLPSENPSSVTPVALQYMYQGSTAVQGPSSQNEATVSEIIEDSPREVFPFSLYDKVDVIDDVTPSPKPQLGRGRRGRRYFQLKDEPSTSGKGINRNEDYEVITDNLEPQAAKKLLSEDEMFKYGTTDPSVRASNVPCGKCGANLHCQDSKLPGFLPAELFKGKTVRQLRHLHCQRCYLISEYNIALKMSVAPDDYPKTIEHLKEKEAIILLIVDLLDFPGSVWPNIIELLGKNKRIILVGNKVDMLPQDSKGYLQRIETALAKNFEKKCKQEGLESVPTFTKTILVSARTSYNIEKLIDYIYDVWRDQEQAAADIYLVGTTNVGKSSIFNLLLNSDLCKVKAVGKVETALTSPVPGTTLNLLKFPVMRPDPGRLSVRNLRIRQESRVHSHREKVRIEMLRKFKDRKLSSITGMPVGLSFTQAMDKNIPLKGGGFDINVNKPIYRHVQPRIDPNDNDFSQGRWCFDTPGTVCNDQIINLLTQEEVLKTLPQLPIRPRSYSILIGQTLFIGGLARFDVIDGPSRGLHKFALNLTVFTSDDLPINIVRTSDADDFYQEGLGSDILAVPKGTAQRLESFPELEGVVMNIDGVGINQSSCDIVLSSAGWIACAPKVAEIFKVKAWTPGGKGIYLRDPPFLPYAIQLRGDKIRRTPAYRNDKIFIPT